MNNCPSASNLLLGAGAIYFNRYDASGQLAGERHLGNCSSFSLATEIIKKERTNILMDPHEVPDYIVTGYRVKVQITLDEYSRDNIALAMAGSVDNTYTQAALVVTGKLYLAQKGTFIKLINDGGVNVFGTTGIVVTNAAGDITYTPGLDYLVMDNAGLIMITEDSQIVSGTSVAISYTVPAAIIPQISIVSSAGISGRITFVGDPTHGPALMCIIDVKNVMSSGGISLIGEDFANIQVTGDVVRNKKHQPNTLEAYYSIIELPAK